MDDENQSLLSHSTFLPRRIVFIFYATCWCSWDFCSSTSLRDPSIKVLHVHPSARWELACSFRYAIKTHFQSICHRGRVLRLSGCAIKQNGKLFHPSRKKERNKWSETWHRKLFAIVFIKTFFFLSPFRCGERREHQAKEWERSKQH